MRPNDPSLREACADEAESLAVSVARFIAAGAMTGEAACWDAAHDCAEAALGPVEGPRLVAAMASVMRGLRAERGEPWRFMPAPCRRVTGDEAALVAAIALARRAPLDARSPVVRGLAGGRPAPRIAEAVQLAAQAVEAAAPRLASGAQAAGLH
jgi:hypothetical protein